MTQTVASSWAAIQKTVGGLVSLTLDGNTLPDPLGHVSSLQNRGESTAVLLSIEQLFNGLCYFPQLQGSPIVLHAQVEKDYGSVSALRHSGFIFLQSFGPEDAQDIAVAAHLVSLLLNKPVIHFFANVTRTVPHNWTSEQIAGVLAKVAVEGVDIGSLKAKKQEQSASAAAHDEKEITNALELVGKYGFFDYYGSKSASTALVVFGASEGFIKAAEENDVGVVVIRVYAPFIVGELLKALPSSVRYLALLEQTWTRTTTWLPLLQDVLSAESLEPIEKAVSFQLGAIENYSEVIEQVKLVIQADKPKQGTFVGSTFSKTEKEPSQLTADAYKLETAYYSVLNQLFPAMNVLNAGATATASLETLPEYGFGGFLAKHDISKSNWIIGSDAWSYDLGNSGLYNVLRSGANLNMLIIDSTPQAEIATPTQRKKDIGLYAMNFDNVYVASVAVYSSYTQLLQALIEAEKFDGPSIVVAYLPYTDASKDDALTVLKETKRAVDTGYWPLYRFNPTLDDEKRFTLDSFTIKQSLKKFLDQENKLTLLSRKSPQFARDLNGGHGEQVRLAQARKAREAYYALLDGLSGPPLTVLFASDGGQAQNVAKRLATRAKGRGLKATVAAFDDYTPEDLLKEENVVFVTSTAGQGEFPQNGRNLWDGLKSGDFDFSNVKVGVFGMGDSQYWPRKQDKHYYNKPCVDLSNRLIELKAQELVPLGKGDDQDPNGWSTGYDEWEPLVWAAMGVDLVDGAAEAKPITNEDMKLDSNYLRGTIAAGLKDLSTGAISASDQQMTKFHGIYMQDDRDIRDARKTEGLEPAYSFMVRVRLPGCVASPEQWLKMDELCDSRGNGTFKITTRGTFQLHGVIKEDLKPAIRGMNSVLLDTVAACGDVDRNVVTAALPGNAKVHKQIHKAAYEISEHLLPQTTAYYEIWLEGEDESDKPGDREVWENRKDGCKKKTKELVSQSHFEDHEPLYTNIYLPRKFKINIAVPPYNDVDVYGHDIGLVAIVDENDVVTGYNVNVGGGMGTTHNNKKTYPRTGSCIGYCPTEKILDVCEKVMLVQRDNGDRSNRKHARLKYTVDDMTHDGFKAEVEKYLGYKIEPKRRHVPFTTNVDTYGWVTDEEGFHHFTTFVENGRVEDTPELQFRSGLREIAKYMKGSKAEFRLTANQHILLSKLTDEQLPKIKELLEKYKLDNISFSGLRLSSQACVAFPTCGLAMAESERYLPVLITKLEAILEEYGLRHDSIVMRMTGCPNGCARPWLAEIACVGKAYGAYNLYLGGGHVGERLNKLYRSSLKEDEIIETLQPMFKAWAHERTEGEPFGDFVIRKGIISATREGKDWWENVEPGVEN